MDSVRFGWAGGELSTCLGFVWVLLGGVLIPSPHLLDLRFFAGMGSAGLLGSLRSDRIWG